METRLNKALADAGICSRRKADELIFAGEVSVNGVKAESPGVRVDTEKDVVVCRGERVAFAAGRMPCRLMLHKPAGVVCTVSDPEGRPTVMDYVPEKWRGRRLYPVGRLDYFSEGLLLLTDDGGFANRLTHPSWGQTKVYRVLVRSRETIDLAGAMRLMRSGMTLSEGEKLAPVEVRVQGRRGAPRSRCVPCGRRSGVLDGSGAEPGGGDLRAFSGEIWLEMTLHQGLNRQIRRMCRDCGLTVLRLIRVGEGPLRLGDLPKGAVRELTDEEAERLLDGEEKSGRRRRPPAG